MYPSQHYQYQQRQPPPPQSQQQQQSSVPPQQPPSQNHGQPSQTHYQGYSYPPPPQPTGQYQVAPAPGYAQYPSGTYPYPIHPQNFYYPPAAGFPSTYPQQPTPTYQSPYTRPPYVTPQSNVPPAYPAYPPQPFQTNGYSHGTRSAQQYPTRVDPGHPNSPPSKRQKLEPRPAQSNGSHLHPRKHSPRVPKEKKQFSDFRISKIVVGDFVSDEVRMDSDARDSRLRFYFRSGSSSHSSPSLQTGAPVDIATQYPDRLSVSLHKGTQRIVLPAVHLSSVQFNRAAGCFIIEGNGWAAFEEIRTEGDDTIAITNSSGFASTKFGPSDVDPTGGEWGRRKVMEIQLSTTDRLTEPKWARGNVRDNIDPSSLFQNILHVADVDPATFEEMIESWRDKSEVGTQEARAAFVNELSNANKLVELLERIVDTWFPLLSHMVERLVALIQNKETLHEEFKGIILGTQPDMILRALNSMMVDEVDLQREATHSTLSSINHASKREREEDQDEEMTMASNEREGSHLQDQSLPPSAIDDTSETRDPSANVDSVGGEGCAGDDEIGEDFPIPDVDHEQTFSEHIS